jgi:hypothetical protein
VAIRQIVGGALAAAAIAGGVGLVSAPNAAALPRGCGTLINVVSSWYDQWQYSEANYGTDDSRTVYASKQYAAAVVRADGAGCY